MRRLDPAATARPAARPRPGTVAPFLGICIVGLFAMVALAIDLGLLTTARTECQDAADAAALTGARTLDNKPTSTNSNKAQADANARATVLANRVLNTPLTNSNIVQVEFGPYSYDPVAQKFVAPTAWPTVPPAGQSYTAAHVVVRYTVPSFFSRVGGQSAQTTTTAATAVHRPRDVAIVLDLTGSMRYGSSVASDNLSAMTADPVYPQHGHYNRYTNYQSASPQSGNSGGGNESGRQNPFYVTTPYQRSTNEIMAPNNFTVPTAGGPPSVNPSSSAEGFVYDPSNVGNPSTSVLGPNSANLIKAFHHYDPTVSAAGDPDNYVAPTYNYSGWSSAKDIPNFVIYPTPGAFKTQSDDDGTYLGDRAPRKGGREQLATNANDTWNPLDPKGAAVNLAEYLGWIAPITSGAGTPKANTPTATLLPAAVKAPTRAVTANTNWSDFRDATWERYGYDLDVADYIANRGASWDPRWDWDLVTNKWVHAGALANPPAATYRPKLVASKFKGYSMGPGYYGKTFFQWPPDPRFDATLGADPTQPSATNTAKDIAGRSIADWRRRFFLRSDGTPFVVDSNNLAVLPTDPSLDNNPATTGAGNIDGIDEAMLRNGTGMTLAGSDGYSGGTYTPGTYQVNYAAILKWIKQPPLCVPPNLRSGRVLYYSRIPDDVSGAGDPDKAFWKKYIDFVLSTRRITSHDGDAWPQGATAGVYTGDLNRYINLSVTPNITDPKPYLHALDNPSRPRSQFWFGPYTMMCYLALGSEDKGGGDNAWSATTRESQTWQLKAGMNSALDDIKNNHPNDAVGLTNFSAGDYGFISVPCGQEFRMLKDSLFYPQSLLDSAGILNTSNEVRAYNGNGDYVLQSNVPNAQSGTDPNSGFAMAYNILTPAPDGSVTTRRPRPNNAAYVNQTALRTGRRGAAKVVIFETDGVPNAWHDLTFVTGGINSYYKYTGSNHGAGNGDPTSIAKALEVVDQIVSTGPNNLGGSGIPQVFSIGFGDLFSTSAQAALDARKFLLDVQKRGNTSSPSDAAIPPEQIITGSYQTRIDSLKTCLERIFQSGVQVTLIE